MDQIFSKMRLCQACKGILTKSSSNGVTLQTHHTFSTSAALQRKRQQRKYIQKVPEHHKIGEAHRFLRGLSVDGTRYGPLLDRPDYTYLDGRPTPLTPDQLKRKQERVEMAAKVMQQLNEIDTVQQYTTEIRAQQTIDREMKLERKLIPKTTDTHFKSNRKARTQRS